MAPKAVASLLALIPYEGSIVLPVSVAGGVLDGGGVGGVLERGGVGGGAMALTESEEGFRSRSNWGRGSFGDRRTASGQCAGQPEEMAVRRQRQGQGAAWQRAGGATRGVTGWARWRLEVRLAGAGDGAASQTTAA
ncbi:hypothetical protein E2562_028370 [Oryza meyeriana var. granulata]|uniref:Uncharacterized protein n=1 Tax=Oryza meyeriana var. granulata TaxID=110450 RepID=A0A6G1CU99_9ORYZ|nr:hypothetical protein E2562_028370 [Oryza meyeriana var. granulata]